MSETTRKETSLNAEVIIHDLLPMEDDSPIPTTIMMGPPDMPDSPAFTGFVDPLPPVPLKQAATGHLADLDIHRSRRCRHEIAKLARAGKLSPKSEDRLGSSLFYLAGHTRKHESNSNGLSARDLYVGYRLFTPPQDTIKNIDEPTFRSHLEAWASANTMLHTVRNGQIEQVYDIAWRSKPLTCEATEAFIEGLGEMRG